jgi:sigma-B regulation protein RsbU (phosphoserine phosphatase)
VPYSVEQDEQRVAALTKLLDVALKLSAEHDEDRILQLVTAGACDALPCERTSLFLLDEVRQELYTRTVTKLELHELRIPVDRGVIGWVARERQVACVCDPAGDNRWDSSIDRQTGFVTRNLLAVPVTAPSDGRLLGVLQLINLDRTEFDTFDTDVAQAFAAHAATALERSRWQQAARRAEAMKREMEVARGIQRRFLPERMPRIDGYTVAAWWQPAEFVSGDYYDWFCWSDHRIGFAVGDVCGHGVGPSLIMASLRAMLRVLAKTNVDPQGVLQLLQSTVDEDLQAMQFVTLLIASLDPVQHRLTFANAGHAPAYHIRRHHGEARRLEATQLPLGFPSLANEAAPEPVWFEPGDLMLLGTDGIIEARNPAGDLFGGNQLLSLALEPAGGAAELAVKISQAVLRHRGAATLADDATLLIVERTA